MIRNYDHDPLHDTVSNSGGEFKMQVLQENGKQAQSSTNILLDLANVSTLANDVGPIVYKDKCVLLDNFGKVIQIVCALLAFSSLVIKRFRESPQRPWIIWGADVSKQIASGLSAHLVGMLTATLVASTTDDLSPCSWYLVAFVTDVLIGVPISLGLLKLGTTVMSKIPALEKYTKTGDYGQTIEDGKLDKQPEFKIWFFQMTYWVFGCVVPGRFVCMGIVYTLRHQLSFVARAISNFRPFKENNKLELVFVMLAGPLLLNSMQYLIQDAFLKFSKRTKKKNGQIYGHL